jgi:hypothetical protein
MLETFELLDPWRTCFPNGRKYAWHQSSPIKQSRLDYFLVSEDLFSLILPVLPEGERGIGNLILSYLEILFM